MNTNNTRTSRAMRYMLEGTAILILVLLVIATVALHITRPPIAYTQQAASLEETIQAKVLEVQAHDVIEDENGLFLVNQRLSLEILSKGEHPEPIITVDYHGMGPTETAVAFREGQRALVMVSKRPDGQIFYQVADHVRLFPLGTLAVLFALITVWVGRWQGVRALLGLALSVVIIGGFVLPQILAHRDAVVISLIGMAVLTALTLYLIQGWNPTGHAALLGMMCSLAFTGLLATIWTRLAHMTGFGSEETMFLQAVGVGIQMRGLLLAGMIIGVAGVLDDVILAQAVTVFELADADSKLPTMGLYRRGMKVGVAHLSSMVNTLLLAYASAALPLMLLFFLYPEPWYLTINRERIAEEIIRAMVGSVGLMLAVPLTTLIAAWVARGTHSQPTEEAE